MEIRRRTEYENKKMDAAFTVFKLNVPPSTFVEKRYLNIKHLC